MASATIQNAASEEFVATDAPNTGTMRAARLHGIGEPFVIDVIDRPEIGPMDVLVEVRACGMVPNLANVLGNPAPQLVRPPLPGVFGLDPAGVVVEVGSGVRGVEVGTRVYVNPLRNCGNCRRCRSGRSDGCSYLALNGYLGSGPKSAGMLTVHPHGGYTEYIAAPPSALVTLPDEISFETAARWGYLGTGYAALRRASVGVGDSVLINGISGTLGLGTLAFALALGASKILGVGRDTELLERVRALAPDRIHVYSAANHDESVGEWARALTDGDGVDVVIDALPTFAPVDAWKAAFAGLGRAGVHVSVGAVLDDIPLNLFDMMNQSQILRPSFWFTSEEGREMVELFELGRVDLSIFEHHVYPLEQVNQALQDITEHHTGFTNVVIDPTRRPSDLTPEEA